MWELAGQAFWRAQQRKLAPAQARSPWEQLGAWALGARGERRLKLREGEAEREVASSYSDIEAAGTFVAGNAVHLFGGGEHRVFEWLDPYLPHSEHADAHGGLRATMPGRVLAVHVKAGDEVAKGAPLVVLEAMKMEQTITAPSAGKIDRVLCEVGEQVREGAELLVFEKA
jgi:3-methylcrotonyl-CoA carboxylase alpha subunit